MYFYEYGAMPWDNYNFQISTVNICTGITGISSFSYLRNLKIINISDTVSEIGDKYSLQIRCASTITVDRDNKFYSSKEGILYDKAQEKLLKCPFEKENVTMPNTVTYIVLNRKLNTSKNKIKLQNKIINRWNIMPL